MSTVDPWDSWKITALIPARGGSKGILGKNLHPLGGLPLIAHAIANARRARRVGRVVVSTDSPEIAAEARLRGAEVPFLRPEALARDETPMLPVVLHAWRSLSETGPPPRAMALLQPTSPFLRPETIDRAVEAFLAGEALHLKAVRRVREHPAWMLVRRGDRLWPFLDGPTQRRQDLPELFIPCGALYLYREAYLTSPHEGEPAAGLEVEWPESLDIDEPRDLELAEWVLERGLAGPRRAP
jgi:CMP-N,N'-diacetyllegionaminic acid synthase